MSKRYLYGLLMVASLLIMASIIILPRKNEVALMQLEDGHFTNALSSYMGLIKKGDSSLNVVMPMAKLYLQYGDIASGIALLENFVAEYPNLADARKQLGLFYQYAQMPYAYMKNLDAMLAIKPDVTLLRELADAYEFHDLYSKEATTLATLIASKDYKFHEEDYLKLSTLYASHKKPAEAVSLMHALYAQYGNHITRRSVNMLVSLLLDNNNESEARTIAFSYVNSTHDVKAAINFASQFRERKKPGIAIDLLKSMLAQHSKNPEFLGEYIGAKIDSGRDDEIFAYLMQQKIDKDSAPVIPETLVHYALRRQREDLLSAFPTRMSLQSLPESLLLRYALFAFNHDKPDIAKALRSNLGDNFLHNTPFITLLLNFSEHRSAESLSQFIAIQRNMELTPIEKLGAITVYTKLQQQERAFAILRTIPIREMMDNFDVVAIAETYLSLGASDEGIRFFSAALHEDNADNNTNILHTLLLLNAGAGKESYFNQLLHTLKNITPVMLGDSFYIADKYQHPTLALNAASLLYAKEPTTTNQLLLTAAYIDNKQYLPALERVKKLIKTDKKAQVLYFRAIALLITDQGKEAAASYLAELNQLVEEMFRRTDMNTEEKRDFAYLLINANMREKAETLLLTLARNAPIDSEDTQQLLSLWEDRAGAEAISWIKERASKASRAEQAKWLNYLLAKDGPGSVIELLEAENKPRSAEVTDVYIDAVIAAHDSRKLAGLLTAELAAHPSAARTRKLAIIAFQENLPKVAEAALRSAITNAPEDSEMQKQLGLLMFAKGSLKEAKQLLTHYLEKEEGDYEVNYAYGELLWRQKSYHQATPYFRQALEQIEALDKSDMNTEIMEAQLSDRLGNTEQALVLFREAYKNYPHNKALRTAYGSLLITLKLFKEATQILGEEHHEE